jgi:ABC-type multidrug transport system fused ATPase/permease subunit
MEKVGVCGRTGSGKSTWFKTCFRLIEPSEGSILIDGIDISTISLDDLRSKLSIIPQDPVLFSGTLRYNLDPFNTHTTEQVERVLEILNLKDVMIRLPQGLDTKIAEAGSNLSAGECQLICVARALLKPSKILFIDEATANIDKETDKLIQNVIRTHFKDRTVMVIAHRLDTIIDSDKIAVLNYGSLEEFGSPSELSQQDGIFASMISKSGIQIQNIKNA